MMLEDLQSLRFRYLRRVLSERWPIPSRVPVMLALGRDRRVAAGELAPLGLRVEEITLAHDGLASLSRRLHSRGAAFDVVCSWDLLRRGDDWQAIVGVMARALRSGGVFFFGVSSRAPDELLSPCDLHATLRQEGLLPQRAVALGLGENRRSMRRAMRNGVVSYMGYAFRRRDRSALPAEGGRGGTLSGAAPIPADPGWSNIAKPNQPGLTT